MAENTKELDLISELTKKMENSLSESERGTYLDPEDKDDILQLYKSVMDSKKPVVMAFDGRSNNFDYFYYDEVNDIRFVLPARQANGLRANEVGENGENVSRPDVIGAHISVVFSEIDDVNRVITCRRLGRSRVGASSEVGKAVNTFYTSCKSSGKPCFVYGTVTRITKSLVMVNIFDSGIFGICYMRDWSREFIPALQSGSNCFVGHTYKFEIIDRGHDGQYGDARWMLSRKNATKDPWLTLPEDLGEGSIITVKCTKINKEDGTWFGGCDRFPEIMIMGYPNTKKHIDIMVGARYVCYIKRLDREMRRLRVAPTQVCTDSGILLIDGKELSAFNPATQEQVDKARENRDFAGSTEEEVKADINKKANKK